MMRIFRSSPEFLLVKRQRISLNDWLVTFEYNKMTGHMVVYDRREYSSEQHRFYFKIE